MKQTKLMVMAMMAVALMATSCASKKDLQNCQNENKELSSNYQATKEKLAATEASLASKIAKIITDYKDYDVLVEGNTDNVPVSTTSAKMKNIRNNWDLSALRAASVVQYLQDHFGVNPKRLTAGGRGEYNPVTTNDTELGKQRNRRTQIIITPKLDQFMDLIDKAPEEK